ncbi:hypothetical protein HKD37_04G011185 [Glycine soja]
MKEEVSSLWGKDSNPKALIQASMLSQSDRDMLRKVGPSASMDPIARFAIKLTTVDNSVKALQEEVELLKKEFALSKVAAEKMKEKMKIDLNEVEVKILKTHEVGFNKAIRQAEVVAYHFWIFPDLVHSQFSPSFPIASLRILHAFAH